MKATTTTPDRRSPTSPVNLIIKCLLGVLYIPFLAISLLRFDFISSYLTIPALFLLSLVIPKDAGLGAGFAVMFYFYVISILIGIVTLILAFTQRKGYVWIGISIVMILLPIVSQNIPDKYERDK